MTTKNGEIVYYNPYISNQIAILRTLQIDDYCFENDMKIKLYSYFYYK